jgi:hypothetical protein
LTRFETGCNKNSLSLLPENSGRMMIAKYYSNLRKQSFWLLILVFLVCVQPRFSSIFQQVSSPAEISQALADSHPLNDLTTAYDLDDCSDLLQTASPEISPTNESSRPLQRSQLRLQSFASGISLAHLSRPPPFSFSS